MSFTRRGVLTAGAVYAAAPSFALARAKDDTQPMWLVRKGAAKVYLYGDGGSATAKWSAPRVLAAFDESRVFWKETPDQAPQDQPKYISAGVDRARPLSTWLTPTERERVTAAVVEAGITYSQLEPLKPWFATLLLNQAYGRVQTRAPMEDPLPVLTARARAAGKPIRTEFPDADSQIAVFNSMSQAAQVEFLFYSIENNQLSQEVIDRRHAAWAAGDLSLETRQVAHLKADYPNLYVPFEAARNRAWPARFHQMLDEGGTSFVLTGADHLVGVDSVIVQLTAAGLKPRRI